MLECLDISVEEIGRVLTHRDKDRAGLGKEER